MRIPTVLIALSVVGCGPSDPTSRSIANTVAGGPGTRLTLAEVATFPWDRVCIFGPYTPNDEVDAVTRIPGAARRAFDIRSHDGINVLMFIQNDRVIASVAHGRRYGDFGPEVVRKCYPRERAVFLVRQQAAGTWGTLGPWSETGGPPS